MMIHPLLSDQGFEPQPLANKHGGVACAFQKIFSLDSKSHSNYTRSSCSLSQIVLALELAPAGLSQCLPLQ